jgi:hypothetical protein
MFLMVMSSKKKVVANSSAHCSVKQFPQQGHLAIVAREIFVGTNPVPISPCCCARE